jgi:hypothetical protein
MRSCLQIMKSDPNFAEGVFFDFTDRADKSLLLSSHTAYFVRGQAFYLSENYDQCVLGGNHCRLCSCAHSS